MALRYKKRLTESTKVDLIITLPTHHRLVLLGYHQQFLMADPVGHLPFTLGDEATRPRLYESIFIFFFVVVVASKLTNGNVRICKYKIMERKQTKMTYTKHKFFIN